MKERYFLYRSAVVASLAGFLFGFDTVVISGAEQSIQALWQLSDGMHGVSVSMALWGTVLGALLGGWPSERFGRKRTLLWIGVLYLVSAVGSALAPEIFSFMFFRFVGGIGVGVSTVAAPCIFRKSPLPTSGEGLPECFSLILSLGFSWPFSPTL
ncbi:MAG TPA: MFS transporter [Bacteroidales bacterium]|nr:MFS transporter [Bacteroidales bacterium]